MITIGHLIPLLLMLMVPCTLGFKVFPNHFKKPTVEVPQVTELNGTVYNISYLVPNFTVKTAIFTLNVTQCLHYSFKLMEKRVRIHAHTCQLGTGGHCTMDKFSYPKDTEGCTYMRPWTIGDQNWEFHFILERRHRVLGSYYHQRLREGKRKRHVYKKETSTKTIGQMILYGIVDCSEVCNLGVEGMKKLGSYSDGTFHRGKFHRLN